MKKEKRQVYVELTKVMKASLCTFCKYAEWESDGCCEGYAICLHPIEVLSKQQVLEKDLEPGNDCYGFRPNISIVLAADIAGAILSQDFDLWFYRLYGKKSATVYGTRYVSPGKEETGKVRIG